MSAGAAAGELASAMDFAAAAELTSVKFASARLVAVAVAALCFATSCFAGSCFAPVELAAADFASVKIFARVGMGQLLFKKCFWQAVRGGTKRTTVRRWATPRLKAGQRAFSPGIGWLTIDAVDVVADLDHLTDADAVADGFDTLAEMKAALRMIYPAQAGDGRTWFRVAFTRQAGQDEKEEVGLFG